MMLVSLMRMVGSSPRMWGTVVNEMRRIRMGRFIPTHVGNGYLSATLSVKKPVHPHACGERTRFIRKDTAMNGSSPRMWGTGEPLR